MTISALSPINNTGRISSALRLKLPLINASSAPSDTFEKQDKFVPFNKMYPREITPKWFNSLSKEDLEKYEQEFNSYISRISLGETKYFTEYANFLQDGMKKLSPDKPFKFIAIGQSPAFFAKIMQVNGKDAGICPISELGRYHKDVSIGDVAKNADKYFEYLKKFNVDVDKIDKNKNYFFSDFAVSGASLRNFRELLKARGIVGDNINVLSMDSIVAKADVPKEKQQDLVQMHNYYLYMQNLKNRYSPIFKLPVNRLNEIAEIERCYLGCPTNNAANAMLYWMLKNNRKVDAGKK